MYPRLRQAGRFDLERVLCRENMGVSIAMSMGFKRLIQVQYYGKPPKPSLRRKSDVFGVHCRHFRPP